MSDALVEALAELIAIPSVSADATRVGDVRAAGEWVRTRIRANGGEAELVETKGAPLVVGEIPASQQPDSAPTVLCYAHFDVQPPDPLELWESPPFELTERDGRLFARGAADDKGNLLVLVESAGRLAAAGDLPVNVRFAFDGEEEVGGDAIVDWVGADSRGADAAIILDGGMISRGVPAFYLGVRGMLYLHVSVRTGAADLHSGMFGGGALNALHALNRALAAVLAGADGRLPAPLRAGTSAPSAEELRAWEQLPSGAEVLASMGARAMDGEAAADFYMRVFAEPSLDVNGIAGGSPDLTKTVLPVEARANVSIRLAPGQDPDEIRPVFERLLREAAPEGAEIEIELRNSAHPAVTSSDATAVTLASAAFERTLGVPPLLVRTGGTLPIYAALVRRGIATLATGFCLESEASMHAPNENIPADALTVGVATMSEVFRGLAGLAERG